MNSGLPTIRREQPGDINAIHDVVRRAFDRDAEADVVDELRKSCADFVSLVAVLNDQVVGHILFTPVVIESDQSRLSGFGLAPLAVDPDFQRRGIGSQLVERGFQDLQQEEAVFAVVLGHPEYYPKFGFETASKHGVRCEYDGVPDEVFMIRILVNDRFDPNDFAANNGVAKYREEFNSAT